MTFNETLDRIREIGRTTDVSDKNFMAVQVNLTGEDTGVFYVEIKDGKAAIEPYEYNDRQCAITMDIKDFNKLLDGKMNAVLAYTIGKLKIDGDLGTALEFSRLIK